MMTTKLGKLTGTAFILSLLLSACSGAPSAPEQSETNAEAATPSPSSNPSAGEMVASPTLLSIPATEPPLVTATNTPEPQEAPPTTPVTGADPVYVRLYVLNESGQPTYLNRDMITLVRVADGEKIGMIGRNSEFSNALQPGDYVLQIEAPGYEKFEQRFAVPENDFELTATLKLLGLTDNPEDLVVFGSAIFRYDTAEVLFRGPSFGQVRYVRPDRRSFLAGDGKNWVIVYPDGTAPYVTFRLDDTIPNDTGGSLYGYIISPDLTKALFELGNDLWIAEVDWDQGIFRNARQVTQVGVFRGMLLGSYADALWHPDGEYVLLNGEYRINLTSGEVKKVGGGFAFGIGYSPDGRYGLRYYPTRIYDLAADTDYPLEVDVQRGCWLSDGTWVYADKTQLRFAKEGKETSRDFGVELRGDLGCTGKYVVGRRGLPRRKWAGR